MIMLANLSSNRAPGYEREREEGGWPIRTWSRTVKPQRPRTYSLDLLVLKLLAFNWPFYAFSSLLFEPWLKASDESSLT